MLIAFSDVLITVVEDDFDECRCQELPKLDVVMPTHQEYMPVHEPTVGLLCHLQSRKRGAIDKVKRGVYGLVLGLNMEGNVFNGDQVDLQWVQLLPIELC